ncbi:MAG: GAF domain-containing sensor histidine kinase [Candidatus Paceibacterota bacterium]
MAIINQITPLGIIFIFLLLLAVSYAVIRYRQMDIRVVGRHIYLYTLIAIFIYFTFYLVAGLYLRFLGGIFTPASYLVGVFIAPIFVFLLNRFYRLVQYLANRYFFASLYSIQESINRLARELNYFSDIGRITDLTMGTIRQTFQLDRIGLIIFAEFEDKVNYRVKSYGFKNDLAAGTLVQNPALLDLLRRYRRMIVTAEFATKQLPVNFESDEVAARDLVLYLKGQAASAAIPLNSGQKLVGLILLGVKSSTDPFTKEELNQLETLAGPVGIAIDNALLYDRLNDFNRLLSARVDEQTVELRAKTVHLQKLLEMRSEFLDVASHQLRTPVSVILGTISMFREGSMSKLTTEQQSHFIESIYHKAKKLELIIRDILSASEMDTDKFTLTPDKLKSVPVAEVITEVLAGLRDKAASKDIELVFKPPTGQGPKVATSANYLEQALFNLVDNALNYTSAGQVDVCLAEDDGRVIIKVKDTGIGIPATDQSKVFDKFARGKNAVNLYTDGSGLGLFITKKIIEAHPDGRISFTSEDGRGSTFIINLPAA